MASSSASLRVVGTVKGPGETANQYVFITSDTRNVKIGEYVYDEVLKDENAEAEARNRQVSKATSFLKILGKISERKLIEHLPDRNVPAADNCIAEYPV